MRPRERVHDPDVATMLERWWDHPEALVRDEFGTEPDAWQLEGLQAFAREPNLAAKACKGPGKTAWLAWCIWAFLATRPHCRINVTSITGANLDAGLWPELAKWQARSPFLSATFEHTATRIVHRQHPKTWWCHARSWPKKADQQQQSDALAGLHEDYAMWVLDESGSMPLSVLATAEAVHASGIETKVLQAGNPTSREGPLYRACVPDRKNWYVLNITGDPDNPKRSPRIKLEWARGEIEKYGRENPWVKVNVFGEFPPASLNALLGAEEVEAAIARKLKPEAYDWAQKRLGCDVARFGDDRTVIFPRQGLAAFRPRVLRHAKKSAASNEIAGALHAAKVKWGSELEFIDATGGWAAGARDILLTAGVVVIEVQFAGKANDDRYFNKRAEMSFAGAKWVQNGGWLPNVPELVAEATAATYTFQGGKFLVEAKEQIKARLGYSPDLWDSFLTTFGLADMPGQAQQILSGGRNRARTMDDDPDDGGAGRVAHDGNPFD